MASPESCFDILAREPVTGGPAAAATDLPDNVVESLAAAHAFFLDSPAPPGIPVRDAQWWVAACAQHERYTSRWEELTGERATSPAWRRGYLVATVCTKVSYLSFAARNFGDAAALRMFAVAAEALVELEGMPGR